MKTEHTPTPWRVETDEHGKRHSIYGSMIVPDNGKLGPDWSPVAHVPIRTTKADCDFANAKFIVTACNSYDALVDALAESERLLQTIRNGYPDIKLDTRVTKACKANRAALKDAGVEL